MQKNQKLQEIQKSQLLSLNTDLIEHVFSFLPYIERIDFQKLCKALSNCKSIEHKVDLSQPNEISHSSNDNKISTRIFTNILQTIVLSTVKFLNLTNCYRLTDIALQSFSQLYNLKALNLTGCECLTSVGLSYISKLPKLTELYTSGYSEFEDDKLLQISNIISLKILHLDEMPLATDDGIYHICSKLTQLQELYIPHGPHITETSILHISELPQLVHLQLVYDEDYPLINLQHLKKINSLRQITYNLNEYSESFLSDEVLQSLSAVTQLRELILVKCDELTDVGVPVIILVDAAGSA